MAEESGDNNDPPKDPPKGEEEPSEGDDLKVEDVVAIEPDELTDEQKTFLDENKADLTDEQREKFGIEPDEEPPLDPEKVKIKVKTKTKKKEETPPTKKEEDDDEVDPEDRQAISKVVREETADLRQESRGIKDEIAVDTFIRDNPEFSRYRAVALKYMKNPSHSNLPASSIMAIISAKDQQAIGAKKERDTKEKVDLTKTGGSQVRTPVGGKVDWSEASPKEIEAQKAKIISQTR